MKMLLSVLLALPLLAGSGAALADQHHGHDRGHDYSHDRGHDHRDHRDHRDADHRHGNYDSHHHWHGWAKGQRYYGPARVVDYRRYRLRPPPRGYHWVEDDGSYLLVAAATGVILDYVLH